MSKGVKNTKGRSKKVKGKSKKVKGRSKKVKGKSNKVHTYASANILASPSVKETLELIHRNTMNCAMKQLRVAKVGGMNAGQYMKMRYPDVPITYYVKAGSLPVLTRFIPVDVSNIRLDNIYFIYDLLVAECNSLTEGLHVDNMKQFIECDSSTLESAANKLHYYEDFMRMMANVILFRLGVKEENWDGILQLPAPEDVKVECYIKTV